MSARSPAGKSAVKPPAMSGEQVELRHGDQRVTVVEVGGGLRTYAVGEREILDGYGEAELASFARGQILIPWPNRLADGAYEFEGENHQLPLSEPEKGNAIHGLTRWASWSVALREPARVRMEHRLLPREGYPFALALALDYALDDDGLSVTLSASNVGGGPCPFGAGAHPYLTAGADTIDTCTLRAPGTTWMRTDERAIPTGSAPVAGTEYDFCEPREIGASRLDTGYGQLRRDGDGRARVVLSAPDGGSVTLWQDEGYEYLMLFTGDSIEDPQRRRRSLGVEPMTCAPNALRSGEGLRTLEAGETFRCAWGIAPR